MSGSEENWDLEPEGSVKPKQNKPQKRTNTEYNSASWRDDNRDSGRRYNNRGTDDRRMDNKRGYDRWTENKRNNDRRSDNRRTDDRRTNDRWSDDRRTRGDDGRQWNQKYSFSDSIDLASENAGRIIGRGGSNIQRIQNKFNVRVNVDTQRNKVVVSSNSEDGMKKALQHIEEQMNEGNSKPDSERVENGYLIRVVRGIEFKERIDFSNMSDEEDKPSTDTGPVVDWEEMNKKSEEYRRQRWAKCPPLIKNFYEESPEVAAMSAKEADRMRASLNNITVSRVFEGDESATKTLTGKDIPNPVWKFEHCFARYPDLLAEITKQGFAQPSPIQAQAWPVLLKGEDLIGIAQTGTGKTLAFLLPAMIHTEYQEIPRGKRNGPNVLVMAPTRELAQQIEKEVNKYSFRGMKAACIYGGGSRQNQIDTVQDGVEIIICTPGRLNDLIEAKIIDVSSVTYLVLDEADRMLDMGFEPQIRKFMLDIRPDRQTVMTSATWPPGVRRLAQSYTNNPIQVCVGSLDLAATQTVTQTIEIVDEYDKYGMIKDFVKNMRRDDKIIIFTGKKVRADDLSSDLTLAGFDVQSIHGSREQSEREQAIADLSTGYVRVLIATDLASRGLDIEDVTHVINYDFPRNIEEYVHRVGRTGRAGRHGTSISYFTREDWGMAKELIEILKKTDQYIPQELYKMADRFQAKQARRSNEMSKLRNFQEDRFGGGRRSRY